MKIYIVGEFVFPNGGAPAKRVKELALGFIDNGYDVGIVSLGVSAKYETGEFYNNGTHTISFQNNIFSNKRLSSVVGNKNILDKLLWFLCSYIGGFLSGIKFLFSNKMKSEDILLFASPRIFKFIPFIIVAKLKGMKMLLDIVEDLVCFQGFGKKLNPLYWDWKAGYYWLAKICDANLTITTGLYNKMKVVNPKTIIVPAIIGWKNIVTTQEKSDKKLVSILYIGALVEKDDPGAMLELVRQINIGDLKIELTIAGYYKENKNAAKYLERIEEEPVLKKSIRLLGSFPANQFQSLLDGCDAIMLLRGNDATQVFSFPTRLVEYLSFKKAVITTRLGDIPHYLKAGQDAILLEPGQDPANIETFKAYIENKERLKEIGNNGYQKGQQYFNRKTETQKILELFA